MKSKIINLIIIIAGVFVIVNLTRSINELLHAGDRIKEIEYQVNQLKQRNNQLKKQLAEVQSPQYLEKIARDKLGLAKEGETVVILPQNSSIESRQTSSAEVEKNLPNWQKWRRLFF